MRLMTLLSMGICLILFSCKSREATDEEETQKSMTTEAAEKLPAMEQLYSAAWFSGNLESGKSADLGGLETCLEKDRSYLLKLALQDKAFDLPTKASEGSVGLTGLDPIESGTALGVAYISDQLEPPFGSTVLKAPEGSATEVASFPVAVVKGRARLAEVTLLISVGGVTFSRIPLHLDLVPKGTACRPETARSNPLQGGPLQLHSEARENYVAAAQEEWITLQVSSTDANSRFGIQINALNTSLNFFESFHLGVSPNQLKGQMDSMRGSLEKIRKEYDSTLEGEYMNPEVRANLLRNLAEEGHRLYNDLFPKDGEYKSLRAAMERIRIYSRAHKPLRIQIIHSAGADRPNQPVRLLLPFGLLYDDPGFRLDLATSTPVDPASFWGDRYEVEYFVNGMMGSKGSLCRPGGIRLAAALDRKCSDQGEWCSLIRKQEQEIQALHVEKWIEDAKTLADVLRGDGEYDLLYYYGHTANGSRPSFNLQDTQSDGLELGVFMDMVDDDQSASLHGNPVVFLNSCRGAAFSGENYHTFFDLMARLGASAFIGTESSVKTQYADEVGRHFLKELASQKEPVSLGRIFWNLRREALESQNGNPMILIYSLLGDSHVKVCS
jgi:hypothetical protein